jgi:hypothetical protein
MSAAGALVSRSNAVENSGLDSICLRPAPAAAALVGSREPARADAMAWSIFADLVYKRLSPSPSQLPLAVPLRLRVGGVRAAAPATFRKLLSSARADARWALHPRRLRCPIQKELAFFRTSNPSCLNSCTLPSWWALVWRSSPSFNLMPGERTQCVSASLQRVAP